MHSFLEQQEETVNLTLLQSGVMNSMVFLFTCLMVALSDVRAACPNGWRTFQQSCYYYHAAPLTFAKASEFCRKQKQTSLAVVESSSENTFLNNDINAAKIYLGIVREGGGFIRMGNLGNIHYTNWASGEPSNHLGREYCAEMNENGKWNDIPCSTSLPFVCETSLTALENGCPGDWLPHGLSCYYRYNRQKNYEEASRICDDRKPSSAVADVESEAENTFLRNLIGTQKNQYLGYERSGYREFRSTSDRPVVYTNWAAYEPNDRGGENCVEMIGYNGKWNDVRCDRRYEFVCKSRKNQPIPIGK